MAKIETAQVEITAEFIADLNTRVKFMVDDILRLDNDTNGNPRYYFTCVYFMRDGKFFRPPHAVAYRGRKYGDGWVFQSYNIKRSLERSFEDYYNLPLNTLGN